MTHKAPSLFDWNIVGPAVVESFKKLDPRLMIKNPVMFVTQVGAGLTTIGIFTSPTERGFIAQLAIWLWFTVLFANFAEAVAEGRGKAQAASLRKARKDTIAARLRHAEAVRHLLGRAVHHPRAHRAARVPDPHDDWRIAERHRHRGHGPRAPAQCPRHERARCGSRRRRGRAAPRQDRHHHARQ